MADNAIERGAVVLDATARRAKTKESRFPHVWLDDVAPGLDGSYLVKGIIERRKLSVIYGPAGDGKTFFTADLAGHIAAGIPWRGRRVRAGLVVYIAAEAGASILRRFYAWRDHRLSEGREGRIPLAIITRGVDLLQPVDVDALLAQLRAIAAEIGLPLALVVFDTLSRSMPGGDENSAQDLTRVIATIDAIRDELEAATVVVHHSGKDTARGARGHSSLCAAADTVVAVVERIATVEKIRDGVAGERFAFDLQVVELGVDSDGDPVTTCIVHQLSEAPPGRRQPDAVSGVARIGLQALQEVIGAEGKPMPETSTIPRNVSAVTIDAWRTRFRLRYGTDQEGEDRGGDAVKKAFRRAREQLAQGNLIGMSDPYVWVNGP